MLHVIHEVHKAELQAIQHFSKLFEIIIFLLLLVIRADLPSETSIIKKMSSLYTHGRAFTIPEELVLAALALDPTCELRLLFTVGRHATVAILMLVFDELRIPFSPNNIMGVPNEPLFVQNFGASLTHR